MYSSEFKFRFATKLGILLLKEMSRQAICDAFKLWRHPIACCWLNPPPPAQSVPVMLLVPNPAPVRMEHDSLRFRWPSVYLRCMLKFSVSQMHFYHFQLFFEVAMLVWYIDELIVIFLSLQLMRRWKGVKKDVWTNSWPLWRVLNKFWEISKIWSY